MDERREKRRLTEKIRQVKGIADEESDNENESVDLWLKKVKEKQDAAKKAKSLEEMDEQFGVSDQVETKPKLKKDYTSSSLKGLRVEHDQSKFREGQDIILTLKDKNIIRGIGENLELDEEDEADVLVNVNLVDDEVADKNVENKKKKPNYKPYDDFDEDGSFRNKSLLNKYDEELDGETKKSFKLGARGVYDTSDENFIKKLDQEHKSRAIKLDILNDLKAASDYMTTEEMEKFKKPKKIRKVMRKTKALKADDLLPLPMNSNSSTSNKINFKQESTSARAKLRQDKDMAELGLDENKKRSRLKTLILGSQITTKTVEQVAMRARLETMKKTKARRTLTAMIMILI